jgi:hypothetical protein
MTPLRLFSSLLLRMSLLAALLVAVQPSSVLALVGRDWTLRTPLPTAESIQSVAVNTAGNLLVAVGNNGEIWTSATGTSWTKQTSGTTVNLLDVIYAGTKFIAVGESSAVLSSTDGITWTVGAALGNETLTSVVYTGSYFVVCGGTGSLGTAQTSTNATTWTRVNPPAVANIITDVTNLGTSIVFAVTEKNILRGNLGTGGSIAWSKLSGFSGLAATDTPVSIASSGTNLVLSALSGTTSKLWTSGAGINWTQQQVTTSALRVQSIGTSAEIIGVGSAGEVWTSPNGTTWTSRPTGDPTDLLGGGKLGSTYVVTGDAGRILSIAPPGETAWTQRLSTSDVSPINDAASNGSGFVTVAENTSRTSPDGTTWTSHAHTHLMHSVTHTGAQYVATGDGAWTSPDGITWTEALTPDDFTLYSVRRIGGQVVAVGFDIGDDLPVIYTSGTGSTWTRKTLPTAPAAPSLAGRSLYGVAALGGLIVAVGDNGLMLRSIDGGSTWVKQAIGLGTNESFTDITFGNNLFAAVTDGGSIWTSNNGSTWTKRRAANGVMLSRIQVAGNQFFAVGDRGATSYSFGGLVWQQGNAGTGQGLYGSAWNGTTLIVVGNAGTILSSSGGQPVQPTLSFALASSAQSESVAAATVTINLTPASTLPVTVALTVSGTATLGTSATSDYKATITPITFAAGETSKAIPGLLINNDKADEVDETAIFSLGKPTGDAALGANKTHTLTIQDDDQIPVFTAQPTTQFVAVGSPISLTATAQGSPTLAGTWKKNNAAAAGLTFGTVSSPPNATFSATAGSAALTHAGTYTVEAKNDAGKALSTAAYLGVVDNTPSSLIVPAGATITLSVKAAGTGLTYRWAKTGDGDLSNSTEEGVSGATTTKLTLKNVGAGDAGVYFCKVTMNLPNGSSLTQNAATTTVGVETSAPIVTTSALPTATVAELYDFTPAATNNPNKWTITGLPLGLIYNSTTGRITGQSQASGSFTVVLRADNVVGAGLTVNASLTINALPANSSGTFYGLADRNATVNKDLGGRLEVVTTANGQYTGKMVQGNVSTTLKGQLTWVPGQSKLTGSHAIPANTAAALPESTLNFEIVPGTNTFAASTTDGSTTVAMSEWANTWLTSAPTTRTGLYNFVIKPLTLAASIGKPQGHSIGTFTLANDGTLEVVGRLADNNVFTTTGTLSPSGEVAVYAAPYNNSTGSLHGLMTIVVAGAGNVDNRIVGNLTWSKAAQPSTSTTRSYKNGFDTMTLATDGSRYTPVGAAERYLLVPLTTNPNIELFFTRLFPDTISNSGNSVVNPDIFFQVFTQGSGTPPLIPTGSGSNPGSTTVTINNDFGATNGSFTYVDQDPTRPTGATVTRTGIWYGVAIRPAGVTPMKAYGYYIVPELPAPGFPPTTVTNSPIVSGDLFIQRH